MHSLLSLQPQIISLSILLFLSSVLQADLETSFENCQPGKFHQLNSEIGTWIADQDHAEVNAKHRLTGKQSLHLFGGKAKSVQLKLNNSNKPYQITFYAERWTRRGPFEFRVLTSNNGITWKEVYQGDQEIKIGGFLTKVTIPLSDQVNHLRFICTSPENSGILIDDVRLIEPGPQEITQVIAKTIEVPILLGHARNPLVQLQVEVEGNQQPLTLASLSGSLQVTDTKQDIAAIRVYRSDISQYFQGATKQIGETITSDLKEFQFDLNTPLHSGTNNFWITCQLKPTANLDHDLKLTCTSATFSNHKQITLEHDSKTHRFGISLRDHGDDGVHTYRIPGLITTNQGTLIGVYDVRHSSSRDLPGDIDVGMSRSTDGGRTWQPMKIIMDMGKDPNWQFDGIGDPAILVDKNSNTIWVAATWSHGNRSWVGSGPGLSPAETGQLMLVKSEDDGLTWSKPINITKQVKNPSWSFLLQGPGKGITMQDGTLVFAAQFQESPENRRLPHSTIIYSKDHGNTWHCGTAAFDDTTEAQVVELAPGTLMLNCRYNRASKRVVMITKDMGKTWQTHSRSSDVLIEPRACMASLINVDRELGQHNSKLLLFSNPNNLSSRSRLTIKSSLNAGITWPQQHQLLLDSGTGRGYSCMTMIDEQTVGILYEGSRAEMTFQRIPLEAILQK